jgi:catalase
MNDQDRKNLVSNIVSSMSEICGEKKDGIINQQLFNFFRADSQLGMAVVKGLGVILDDKIKTSFNIE